MNEETVSVVEEAVALAERHVAAIDLANDALDVLDEFRGSAIAREFAEEHAQALAAARREFVAAVEAFQCDALPIVRALLAGAREALAARRADDAP